jgi:hypothetical protein
VFKLRGRSSYWLPIPRHSEPVKYQVRGDSSVLHLPKWSPMTKAEQTRLVRWRLRMLQHASESPRSVSQTCRHFGISRKAFYKWRKRHEKHGDAGLCDRHSNGCCSLASTSRSSS